MKVKRFLEYLVVLFLILNCNSVYSTLSNKNYYIREILVIILFALAILQMFSSNFNKKKVTKTVMYIIIYYCYIALFYFINNVAKTYSYDYIWLYAIVFPLLFFIYNTSNDNLMIKNLLYKIPKVMTVLAIISLFFYFFGTLTNIISPTGSTIINWGTIRAIPSYFGIHFNAQVIYIFGGNKIIRNTGIFAEAPMYSLNLIIALVLEMFVCDKKSNKRKYILIVTILTTLSTTGIILALVLYIILLVKERDKDKLKQNIKILLLPAIFIIVLVVSMVFFTDKLQSSSYSYRTDDFSACYLAWKEHLFIGNGFKENEMIINYMDSSRTNIGLSTSLMVLLAQCGLYLFIFYLIPAIRAIRYGIKKKETGVVIFTSVIIILFITTLFSYKPIIINFLAIGYTLSLKKEKKNV